VQMKKITVRKQVRSVSQRGAAAVQQLSGV